MNQETKLNVIIGLLTAVVVIGCLATFSILTQEPRQEGITHCLKMYERGEKLMRDLHDVPVSEKYYVLDQMGGDAYAAFAMVKHGKQQCYKWF